MRKEYYDLFQKCFLNYLTNQDEYEDKDAIAYLIKYDLDFPALFKLFEGDINNPEAAIYQINLKDNNKFSRDAKDFAIKFLSITLFEDNIGNYVIFEKREKFINILFVCNGIFSECRMPLSFTKDYNLNLITKPFNKIKNEFKYASPLYQDLEVCII